MANEYFVNETDLTSVADAIRAKGETTEQLVFPGGFVAAIAGMETGKTGATLTVTTPAEGITVTVAKGDLIYTETSGADFTATFTGLETGTWTITISDGSQTATGTVDIDTDYAAELTFFKATINVIYPTGLVCTATDGVTTLTAPDTSGTWACIVPNAGTWTVSTDVSSADVTVTEKGQVTSVTLPCYLYNNGDECTLISGGWGSKGLAVNSSVGIAKAPTIIRNTNNIVASIYDSNQGSGVFIPTNKIDATNYNTLTFTGSLKTTKAYCSCSLMIWSTLPTDGWNTGYISRTQCYSETGSKTVTNASVDLSGVTGEILIGFGLYLGASVTMSELKVT
ncbi:MAG: hypothetical protein ACI3VJ_06445 [Hominicoprocola sp.]